MHFLTKEQRIEKLKETLDQNIELWSEVLIHIALKQVEFKKFCKKQNDYAIRECCGDLMCLMSQKKLPPKDVITKLCIRVKRYIFPNGIKEGNFHQGEKGFYEKYLKVYEEEKKEEYEEYIKTVGGYDKL
jgi:hypothetical protein